MRTLLDSAKARVMNVLMMLAFLLPRAGEASATTGPVAGYASRRAMLAAVREEKAEANTKAVSLILVGSILLMVSIVVAIYFFPVLTSTVAEIQADENTTTRDSRLVGLIPTIAVVVILLLSIGFLVAGIKEFF